MRNIIVLDFDAGLTKFLIYGPHLILGIVMYSEEYFLYIVVQDKILWDEGVFIQNYASVDISPHLLFIAVDKASDFIGAHIIHSYFCI